MARIEDYPNLNAAFREVADIIRNHWVVLAEEHRATGAYVGGLFKSESVKFPMGNELEVSVINLAPHAAVVEYGHPGFHLPSRVKNWPHRNPKGRGYIRVPFRHFTPGNKSASARAQRAAMPAEIYQMAKSGPVRGLGNEYKQSKSYVYYKAKYPNFPANLMEKARRTEGQPGYTWRAPKYEGMVRMAQVTENANQGVYSTFRTMSEDSAGWYIPPLPGEHYAEQVVKDVKPIVTRMLEEAARKDAVVGLVAMLTAGGLELE